MSAVHPIVLAEMLQERGFSQQVILYSTGINCSLLESVDNQINIEQFLKMMQRATELLGNPTAGLEFGKRLGFSGHDYLSLGFIANQTFSALLQFFQRCLPILNPAVEFTIHSDTNSVHVDIERALDWKGTEPFIIDTTFSLFSSISKAFDHSICQRLCYHFRLPENNRDIYQSELIGQLHFNTPYNRITFPRDFCEKRLTMHNPSAVKQAESALLQQLKLVGNPYHEMYNMLKGMITSKKCGDMLSLQEVAKSLNVSPRTLNRRFQDIGTNFKAVINEVRKDLAISYLTAGATSIEEVSFKLGYKDVSSFSKAFKGWSGHLPSHYKKQKE